MPNYNRIIMAGHLTRDPELSDAGSTSVCKFGIATTQKYKDKEDTCFVDCEAWGRMGEVIAEHLSKGRAVLIEGQLKLDQWQDKDGNKRSKHKIRVDSFQFIGAKNDERSDETPRGAMKSGGRRPPPGPTDTKSFEPIDDSQIPF